MYHDVLVADWALAGTEGAAPRRATRSVDVGRTLLVDSWACKMRCVLLALGYEWAPDVHPTQQILNTPAILKLFEDRLCAAWATFDDPPNPRSYNGPDYTLCAYSAWMAKPLVASEEAGDPTRYLSLAMPLRHVHALATLRACAWPLAIYRPLVGAVRRGRSARVCKFCTQDVVEDEQHVVLECSAYSALRVRSGLCFGVSDLCVFLSKRCPRKLGAFVHAVRGERDRLRNQTS